MTTYNAKFLQIHTLTSYPAALLNRDDIGFSKRMPFGGVSRTRVSSQCLKRHWRRFEGPESLALIQGEDGKPVPMSVRSRITFDREIKEPLMEAGVDKAKAEALTEALLEAVLQKSKARSAKEEEEGDDNPFQTGQVVVLGRPEVDFFLKTAHEVAAEHDDPKEIKKAIKGHFTKEAKKNLFTMLDAGLDCAMFGRMVTSDILSRTDAAIHVAHAFTVHGENVEEDYFSAADDLVQEEGETGSGHINSTELTSGLYYSYVVVDLPLLVSNLTGCKQEDWQQANHDLAQEVIRRMVKLIATVSPGAKLGSTAPYAYAQMMMIESGCQTPRTLANAFMKPVKADQGQVVEAAYRSLAAHVQDLDQVYGGPDARSGLALGDKSILSSVVPDLVGLDDLAQWAASEVSA